MRQWVLTVPYALRFLLAQKASVLTAVHRIAVMEIERVYVAMTGSITQGAARRGGSVTFVHRFSGSLSLHPHFHVVAVDGVFVRDSVSGPVRFVAVPALTPEVLADVVKRIARRVTRWLRRHGYARDVPEEDRSNEAAEDDPLTDRGLTRGSVQR